MQGCVDSRPTLMEDTEMSRNEENPRIAAEELHSRVQWARVCFMREFPGFSFNSATLQALDALDDAIDKLSEVV